MQETVDKRIQILEAAVALFAQKGFHQATVEEIAVLAGVGKGTVYEYFESKKHLFQEMLTYITGIYYGSYRELLEACTGFKEKLEMVFRTHLRFIYDHRDMARLILYNHHFIGEELQHWMVAKDQERSDHMAEILEEGVRQGQIRPVDCQVAARIMTGALWSMAFELVFLPGEKDLRELEEKAIDVFWQGLSPTGCE
ncbi:MAG TPA: TetR/AcrR family transcriptional regulator [Clostridia bacterium]|nr:TetR/AcrR family transcriptional regulator [Clostridia bacterium]